MQANRFVVREAVTVSPEEDLVAAARKMREKHVGFLVVTDERNHPIGVLSDRDILIESVAEDMNPHNIKVVDVMTSRPLLATEEEDLESFLARMRNAGVRRAPVVNQTGLLIGIISFDDLLLSISGMLSNMAGSVAKQLSTERKMRGYRVNKSR